MADLAPDVINSDPVVCFGYRSSTRSLCSVPQRRGEAIRQARSGDGRIVSRIGQKSNSP
jgi:hypothetical protein